VHEAYLRLVKADIPWQDRVHFFAVAARSMRRILVEHARARKSTKRGGGAAHVSLDAALLKAAQPDAALIAIDDALKRLEELDERKSRVVELHFFGGLEYGEIADLLAISPSTVRGDMRFAKAWLRRELAAGGAPNL
jgi:RNA polymerase sigma factor (TIGR02999 family)